MWKGAVWAADVSSGSPSSTSVKCGSRDPSSSASTVVAPCGEIYHIVFVCNIVIVIVKVRLAGTQLRQHRRRTLWRILTVHLTCDREVIHNR